MYASVLIADFLVRDKGAKDLLRTGTGWNYKQVNLHVSVDKDGLRAKAEEVFSRFRIMEERDVDGMKLLFKDGSWVMFRVSGTEPVTRIYCESKDLGRVQELIDEGVKCVEGTRGNVR